MNASLQIAWEALPLLLQGLIVTVQVTASTIVIATFAGILVASAARSDIKLIRVLAQTYIWIFRGIPVLVVLMFVFYGFPSFGLVMSPFAAGVVGMSITSTAYEAEIFRAGLNAVPLGQAEAGHAIGMARIQVFRRVVLPQAWRISVPPYINQAIIIVQSSAQVSVIAVADITMNATLIYSANFKPVIVLATAASLYLFLSSVLNVGQRLIERRLTRYSIV